MLKVNLNENVLTVVTPIKKETAQRAFSEMKATDDKGNVTCYVATSNDGKGGIYNSSLLCNTVVDGYLAVMLVLPEGTTLDGVKKVYGQSLVNLEAHIGEVVEAVEKEITAIDGMFEEAAQQ